MNVERQFRRRLIVLVGALGLFAAALGARLVRLQILDADNFRARAREQHEGNIRIEGRRGTIWDRSGRELAVSVETKSAYVHPRLLTKPAEKELLISGVAAALGQTVYDVRALIDNPKNRNFVFLKRRLGPREVRALEALKLPCIGWMTDSRRFYPGGELAAHLLGFVDIDGKGQAGIERQLDDAVQGDPTILIALRDALGRPLMIRPVSTGLPGSDVVLTIDATIQHLADTELDRAMQETGSKKGTVIVLDPRNGEILAIANRPTFDPNRPGASTAEQRENSAVSYGYEPGSTFKVLTAAAAIEEGRVRPSEVFDCGNGSITIHGRHVGDHHPYGALTVSQIVAKSSNVGIIKIGQRMPEATFCRYVRAFGFGRKTGVTLPSESAGILQVPGGRTWSGLSQPMMAMGQSIFVTPLQMLTALAAIGAGGERHAPRIIQKIIGPDGSEIEAPREDPIRVVSARTAATVTSMMALVVEDGTGKSAAIEGYTVAGKTGTAQKVVDGVYSHTAHVASFAGFVPAVRPRLAAIVVLDEPSGGYYGGDIAAPVFTRIVGPALAYLRVPPDRPLAPLGVPEQVLRARAEESRARKAKAEKAALAMKRERKKAPRSDAASAQNGEAEAVETRPFPAPWPPAARARAGEVPDLYGWNLRDALVALASCGCAPRARGIGFVVSQQPSPGASVSDGDPCTIDLAFAPPPPANPDQGL